ncbi:CBS domain-containing protein [Streptosporangium algeriense]|uniref:CBS domain-containing protein n=1 Tax=Streptosporangium algeriense TaxID=1682748 RepID=A0ABW3DJU1_9ACTN
MLPANGERGITLRIEHLPTSRLSRLVSVAPNDTPKRVKTLFTRHRYAQFPVLTDSSTPAGAVTRKSIMSADMTGRLLTLTSVTQPVTVASIDAEVRKVFPSVGAPRFVLVRDEGGLISGIVTLSDVSKAHQKLSGPYLLIGEIESRLRKILNRACASIDELRSATGRRAVKATHELTMGDLERAFSGEECWTRLDWDIDQDVFTGELRVVRKIRNKFAHYQSGQLSEAEENQLTEFLGWLEELTAER